MQRRSRACRFAAGLLAQQGRRRLASGVDPVISQFVERYRSGITVLVVCSVLLNVLTFGGTLYMLLVYDSVIPSRSVPTLFGLFLMLAVVYLFQSMFEGIRGEALLGIANGVRSDLSPAVHHAVVERSLRARSPGESDGMQLLRDLDQVHGYLSGPGPAALIDLPWVLVFLVVLTLLHWSLGLAALAGAAVLGLITWLSSRRTSAGMERLTTATGRRGAAQIAEIRFAESAAAMGMRHRLYARAAHWDADYVEAQSLLARVVQRYGGAGRTFRIFLQSIMLTIGALLVINGEASGGVIIASSVLTGRMLAPVDSAIATWRGLDGARAGWQRLIEALVRHRPPAPRQVALPAPAQAIALRDVWVAPPGSQTPVIGGVTLTLTAGQALAIIGPSAAGKTTLIKALLGIWPPLRGEVRFDGATIDQWDAGTIGASFGYVPQAVELIDGTIGENIARFDPSATSEGIVAAATAAGLHGAILSLPDGYETRLSTGGVELSAGQRQRVGLARALYGDPFLVVLDEANSNLDAEGDAALAAAIEGVKARGGVVVMVTHRPAALGPVTHIALLQGGRLADFGPRDEVLQRIQKANTPPPPGPIAQSVRAARPAGGREPGNAANPTQAGTA